MPGVKMPRKSSKQSVEYTDPRDELLSLFIRSDGGEVIGESIGVEGEMLVAKSGDRFYLLPLSALRKEGGELLLVGEVDWEKAREEGESWRSRELDYLWGEEGG